MFERSWSFKVSGPEKTDLKIALYEQKQVIEKLQEELNAEREASATSANEAMSMILKLQVEKSELAMEATQYKRIVEEQMSHAEMSFAVLEDLIHQKEIEVNDLKNQVEVYRSQLLRLGFNDLNRLDVKLQENDDDRSQTPCSELVVEKEVIEESLDLQRSFVDVCLEKVKKLDEQVKELADKQHKSLLSESGAKQTRDRSGKRSRRGYYEAELQRLRQRVEKLERGKTNTETETSGVVKQEEISLMKEELSSVQSSEVKTKTETETRGVIKQEEISLMKEKISSVQSSEVKTNTETETSGVIKQEKISLVKKELISVQSSVVKNLDTVENLQSWIDPTIVSVQEAMLYFGV